MIVNKIEFIKSFLNDEVNRKSSNLKIIVNDDIIKLVNYNTIIASKKINDNIINLNISKYSQRTSRNQNERKRQAEKKGFIIKEYQAE